MLLVRILIIDTSLHKPVVMFTEFSFRLRGSEINTAASTGQKTPEREKLSGRQEPAGEIPSRRGEIIAIVITIAPDFIGIIIISITSTFISTITMPSHCNILS
jgi:hypothetical protein